MQRLGQHFLKNEAVVKKIIDVLALRDSEVVIEIGPGRGALTIPLGAACAAAGGQLVAIEKDAALAGELAKDFAVAGGIKIEVITGDALKLLPSAVAVAIKANKNYTIVGNIPYYITGKLLRVISGLEAKPRRCVLMVQHEVAERICAKAPDMNRLSASVQFWAKPSIATTVPRTDFDPAPNVDSAVILLEKHSTVPTIAAGSYYKTVRALFAQPRKTILNNLAAADQKKTKADIEAALVAIGVQAEARPQDLSVEKIVAIAGAMGITL